ncbi:MAG: glycosyltransferase family 9 protein [candidate division KSB1 bacterium]|nr:glycosyltransferase family 9 protein [candidate division KSB1 bacterium]
MRQHDQLGDFLLATPVLRALRKRFPEARLGVVVRGYTEPVVRHLPHVDEILVVREALHEWTVPSLLDFLRRLLGGWDLAVVLNTVSHSLTSDLIARFSRARWTMGPAHLRFPGTRRNFFYNVEVSAHPGPVRHQSLRNLDIVRPLGIDRADPREEMCLLPSEIQHLRQRLNQLGVTEEELLVVHPGAGKPGNRWPAERFGEAARRLSSEYPLRTVVVWGPREESLGRRTLLSAPPDSVGISGLTIRELAALFRLARLVLCNDTGSMHLAAAVGTPLVAIFGPTDPREWKPWGDSFVAVRGRDGRCESVAVEEVVQAATQLLGTGVPQAAR